MLRLCLCMLAGAYALALCRELPNDAALMGTAFCTAASLCLRKLRLLGFVLLGLLVMWCASRAMLEDRLLPELQGQTLAVTVKVATFPEVLPGSVRFVAQTEGPTDDSMAGRVLPRKLRLSWYEPPEIPRIGETWHLQVRLKRPRGFANGTGFDYELWLARQRIGATGYVIAGPGNAKLDAVVDRRSLLRQRLVGRIVKVTGENEASAVLLAVTVGALHLISKEQWERYAISGTSHLMAISGLHIGLAAGGAWLLCRLVLPLLSRSVNVRDLAALTAVVAACVYAEISGLAIPARRAALMALLAAIPFILRRQLSPDKILAASCLAIFAGDPLAVHAPGFKLSFGAVAILLWIARQHGGNRTGGSSRASRFLSDARSLSALQFTLLLGLFPMTVLVFGRISWLAPLVNLLVLPLFNTVTVPAALLGLLLDGPFAIAGDSLLRLSWHSVRLTLSLIDVVSAWPPARVHIATPTGIMPFVVMLAALPAFLPPGFPGRKLAWIAAVATLLFKPAAPPGGCVDLVALEVGQGLSVVLRTRTRTLVYDTGPSFRGGSDIGQLVLVPWLRATGVRQVDLLVVSHSDDDHAGGARSLVDTVKVRQLLAGEPLPSIDRPQLACRSGQAWIWDGIRFGVMHPGVYPLQSNNNASCVLEVAAGRHRILLTGDIESPIENHLVRSASLSPVDIVTVPHHGSRTSSGSAFVSTLRPSVAIVSAGHGNRWGFPKEDVVARWREAGARVMNTAVSGAIHYRVCTEGGVQLQSEQRSRTRRYWHEGTIAGKNF
ncbi:MAG TPA: DNA internalization-related competence protein ComEC/Rec2 [Woeseiaceae bacterium]|nr:DNA internalization-related competence protein ComEC/Rec2 [Woeseiaceae bacterium]